MSTEIKPYSFKLLRDEVADSDLFLEKTHEKVAYAIAELIESETGGVTIGLEGTWGSGKSTVIAILNKKLKEQNDFKIFTFDAWAHQGDPLRRIFLESLNTALNSTQQNEEFEHIQGKISNREKIIKISTTRTITKLGRLLSVSTFFVPVGLALMSLVRNVNFAFEGNPHILFIIALLFTCMPLLMLAYNYYDLKRKKVKDIFNSNNWSFLKEDSEQNIKQEVSEQDERSSVEFEKYFISILKLYFTGKDETTKVIIVIDNLDRVDSSDALMIWSTLQTFLQQRNHFQQQDWFKKLWIIVPYDPEGLSLLWRDSRIENTSKAFFDKNFQIRFQISRPILSEWTSFTRTMLDKALLGWSKEEKNIVLEVLILTRKDLNDNPSPREIKNYINQLAFLVNQNYNDKPIKSIAYYVVLRQLCNLQLQEIRAGLLDGTIPENSHKSLLPVSVTRDLAGLVFGVSSKSGNQYLLEPEIEKHLNSGISEEVKKLLDHHNEDFLNVLQHHLSHRALNFPTLLRYAASIYTSISLEHHEYISPFIDVIKKTINDEDVTLTYSAFEKEGYAAIIRLIAKDGNIHLILRLIDKTGLSFESQIKQNKINHESIEFFLDIQRNLSSIDLKMDPIRINFHSSERFFEWTNDDASEPLCNWILPTDNVISEISNSVRANVIPENIDKAITYILKSKVEVDWSVIISGCQTHLTGANFSGSVFHVLSLIALNDDKHFKEIEKLISLGQFHHIVQVIKTPTVVFHASILCGFVFGSKLNSTVIPTAGNSIAGFASIKEFWNKQNKDNAIKVLSFMSSSYHYIWALAEDPDNKLIVDILDYALGDERFNDLFKVDNSFNKLSCVLKLITDDSLIKALIEKFSLYSELESDIISMEYQSPDFFTKELTYIVKFIQSEGIFNKIANKMGSFSKESWLIDLSGSNKVVELALEVRNKMPAFELNLSLFDALFEYCETLEDIPLNLENNWSDIVSLLSDYYQKKFHDRVTTHFISVEGKVNPLFNKLSARFYQKEVILQKGSLYTDMINEALNKKDFTSLNSLNDLFSKEEVNQHYTRNNDDILIIEDRIKEINVENVSEDQSLLLKTIAEKLGIDLQELPSN